MKFIEQVFAKLEAHPKRILFPEGTEPRVIAAAVEFTQRKLGVAVLLGKKDEVHAAAETAGVKLNLSRVHVIDPEHADDLPTFIKRLETLNRYKGIAEPDARKIVVNPNYFGAMMLHHGQVDALVGGATSNSGSILRPLFQLIKPLSGVKSISSCMVLQVPQEQYGERGVFVFCGLRRYSESHGGSIGGNRLGIGPDLQAIVGSHSPCGDAFLLHKRWRSDSGDGKDRCSHSSDEAIFLR